MVKNCITVFGVEVLAPAHMPNSILTPDTQSSLCLAIMKNIATFWKRAHVCKQGKLSMLVVPRGGRTLRNRIPEVIAN